MRVSRTYWRRIQSFKLMLETLNDPSVLVHVSNPVIENTVQFYNGRFSFLGNDNNPYHFSHIVRSRPHVTDRSTMDLGMDNVQMLRKWKVHAVFFSIFSFFFIFSGFRFFYNEHYIHVSSLAFWARIRPFSFRGQGIMRVV